MFVSVVPVSFETIVKSLAVLEFNSALFSVSGLPAFKKPPTKSVSPSLTRFKKKIWLLLQS
jgi:hypothetical protein